MHILYVLFNIQYQSNARVSLLIDKTKLNNVYRKLIIVLPGVFFKNNLIPNIFDISLHEKFEKSLLVT